jgi:hypothetical protein
MRAQWEELHRRTIRKRKERADERDGLHDDDPYGGRHRSSSSRQQPAAHPLDQQLGPTARQPTMTSTYATGYSPLSGGPWPWPTDSRFGGGSGDDWWPAFRGGGGSRGIPKNPAPLALEHVMPFLADYDFTTTPLVVTTLQCDFDTFYLSINALLCRLIGIVCVCVVRCRVRVRVRVRVV